ncbi:MAG: phosphoribosylformylglycinamidine cyclo-ligase, partial [Alkalispirochaeta sp.]
MNDEPLDYRSAGVNVGAGQKLVRDIEATVAATQGPEVLGNLGGFAGLYALGNYRDPVLVSGTDGVGTKVELARAGGRLDTIGIDLVAMCVNDVICHGARPLFFLDYMAVDDLSKVDAAAIVAGVAEGCRRAGCALIGGETAEMPGVYRPGRFDLAGFAVGAVERDELIDGSALEPGMAVVGLASSGFHSNGYSLLRKLFPEVE